MQYALPLWTLAPHSDAGTSRQAARSMAPHLARLESRVLAAIRLAGTRGLCDHEIEEATSLKHQTASARRRELVLKGLVADSGLRRKSSSGRLAKAWMCPAAGQDAPRIPPGDKAVGSGGA